MKQQTIKKICSEAIDQGLDLTSQIAYILATVEHETAGTFESIAEYGGNLKRYAPYYGRGYVQLTWKQNYREYTKRLRKRFPERAAEIDLVQHPDQAMDPEFSLFILIDGFKTGVFTGKKLTNYVNEDKTDFVNARRVINGLDRAEHIAGLAEKYQEQLDSE